MSVARRLVAGFWEAAHVADVLAGVLGDDPDVLLRLQTESVVLPVNVDQLVSDAPATEQGSRFPDVMRAREDVANQASDVDEDEVEAQLEGLWCTDMGSVASTLPVLCHQHRSSAVAGNASRSALQNPQGSVADRQDWSGYAMASARAPQVGPGPGGLVVPFFESDEILGAVGTDPDHHWCS